MARKPEERTARKSVSAKPVTSKPARKAVAAKAPRKPAAKTVRKPAAAKHGKPLAPPVALPAPSPADVARELEGLNRRYYDAFQSLDAEEIDKLWWHDDAATCVHPGWDARHGWAEIRASYEEIFSNTRSIRFALGDVRTHLVGDVAFVKCVENLVSQEGDSGDYLGAVLATNVFERRRGDWRLILHHASPFASDEADLPEGPLH